MKGGSSSFGEREERIWHFSNPGKQLLKSTDKIREGYYFYLGDCVLSGVCLGSTPEVQTSRRLSRPALRLTYFFCLPSLNTSPQEDIKQP